MPASSLRQFRFFKAIAEGNLTPGKGGPSRKVAQEFVAGQSPKGLPKRARKAGKAGGKRGRRGR